VRRYLLRVLGRSGHQDAACHKIIEQLADRGQVLFE
jgi:hypothetical protein